MVSLLKIKRFIALIKTSAELIELRCDRTSGTRKTHFHGYYNDHDKLAHEAQKFDGDVYITVNRLDPNIPATNTLNRCKTGACTSTKSIIRRTLLYIDFDVVKATGTGSTDEQHKAAIELARFVRDQLGWPMLLGSSGNGACLYGLIDLPADSPLVKQLLRTIKAKWETPKVSIDLSVANAARICRILGTPNHKAGRVSEIIDAPPLTVIPTADLEAFAPLPKVQVEKNRVQQLVTSRNFGQTTPEQIAAIQNILNGRIAYTESDSPDSKNTVCHWFHFDCVFRPDQNDAQNWIKVHPTEGVSGGCHHAKCRGKKLIDILAVIAPETAAQAAEAYDDSYRLARSYLQGRSEIVFWQGSPHGYNDGVYKEESEVSIKADINLAIKKEFDILAMQKTPNVTTSLVNNVYAAASAITFDRADNAPHWRTPREQLASEFLLFRNGLLHVPSYLAKIPGYFCDPTPEYFALAKLPYDFLENAPEPQRFIEYCNYQWTDASNHLLLDEMLGDILLADPRKRVFYGLFGKPQSGKSALTETIENMVGEQNRCAVDLQHFASTFGLEGVVGKKLILVSEAGLDARYSSAIVEKIKRITGNDLINISRKHKTALSLRMDAKIVVVSNNFLRLIDDSGALFDRLTPLQFTKAIPVDKQDQAFPLKLREELPGIVLRALKGWARLNETGRFTLPESSKQVLNELRETGSPALTFIGEKCLLEKDSFTPTDMLFNAWESFCIGHDVTIGKKEDFVTALKTAAPELKKDRQRIGGSNPIRGFAGIKLIA